MLLSELLTGQIPYQHTFMTPVQVSLRARQGVRPGRRCGRQASCLILWATHCTHGALTKGSICCHEPAGCVAACKHYAQSLAPAECRERQHSGAHLAVAALRVTARGSHLTGSPRSASSHTAVAPSCLVHCAAPALPPCRLPWVLLMRSCSRHCPPTCRPTWWSLPRCAATLTPRCGRPLWTLRQSWTRWSSRWRCVCVCVALGVCGYRQTDRVRQWKHLAASQGVCVCVPGTVFGWPYVCVCVLASSCLAVTPW